MYGYTTDPSVASVRVKLQDSFRDLLLVDKRYFIGFLETDENQNFVEVQGLSAQHKVIHVWNGVWPYKPRILSPKHSELYG